MYSLVCNLQANGAEVRGQSERIISFLQNIHSLGKVTEYWEYLEGRCGKRMGLGVAGKKSIISPSLCFDGHVVKMIW